jgi:polar amino acid transport system substrate-binding protein
VGVAFFPTLLVRSAVTETRKEPEQTAVLRWGGDKDGGAPYIYEDRTGKLNGFEVQLADYLAAQLHRHSEFVQKEWDSLPQELRRGEVDCILNGYEWTADREQAMASTIPYYVYRLQLVARRDDDSIQSWDDLRPQPGQRKKRIGVLSASAAHRYVERVFGQEVDIVALGTEGTTGVMLSVAKGQLDATVQDLPAAQFYVGPGREFPSLRLVGSAVEPGYYVIFVRKGDTQLRDQLNTALRDAIRNGTLQRIYEEYGMWNPDQDRLARVADDWPPKMTAASTDLSAFAATLTRAAGTTVLLTVLSMPLAMLLGLMVALGRLFGPRWLGWLLSVYVEVLRGTPLLLQLFAIYYFLPDLKITLLPFWAGVLGLAINYSAYEAENYRAGLQAVPVGQLEAALALGMSRWTALRRVIVPQAVRLVVPPVTNDFIALFKDTAVCAVISAKFMNVPELTGQCRDLMVTYPHLIVELGIMTALLYLLMSYPLSLLARRLEKRVPKVAG